MILSNVVKQKELREVQLQVMSEVADTLYNSFGPMGSDTCIKFKDMNTIYTKDGYSILKRIVYNGPIEQATVDDLVEVTKHIVTTVGDGSTSAVLMSQLIFKGMCDLVKDGYSAYDVTRHFENAVSQIKEEIMKHKRECTVKDIYNIALISTNGNEEIAMNLKNIYEEFGMDVFIDVALSTGEDSHLKIYDGMTLDAGYADSCFITNAAANVAVIENANVYVFEDPIDTPEMVDLLDAILRNNILAPYAENRIKDVVPTVILAPKISRDMSAYMEKLSQFLFQIQPSERPPVLVITNIFNQDQMFDIAKACGARTIRKYIDQNIQVIDIKSGAAPTPETVCKFHGFAKQVEADGLKTKFIEPKDMYDENHEYTASFKGMIEFLEAELKKAKEEGEDANVTGNLKRRINSLKANMVEYLVGGISQIDRDSKRDLVEDAVLNCRSAARAGVGYGANFEGFRAAELLEQNTNDTLIGLISEAYEDLTIRLYNSVMDEKDALTTMQDSFEKGCPYNIRAKEYDGKVLSSIESDIIVLETIAKIVLRIFGCNQFLVPTPMHNTYLSEDVVK